MPKNALLCLLLAIFIMVMMLFISLVVIFIEGKFVAAKKDIEVRVTFALNF
jgi:hypothetical protein